MQLLQSLSLEFVWTFAVLHVLAFAVVSAPSEGEREVGWTCSHHVHTDTMLHLAHSILILFVRRNRVVLYSLCRLHDIMSLCTSNSDTPLTHHPHLPSTFPCENIHRALRRDIR